MKQILLATKNPAKIKRYKNGLLNRGIKLLTLDDIKVNLEIQEDGQDALENALIKARNYYQETGITVMAIDDNLFLENVPMEKQPGSFVRRVNKKRLSDLEMLEYYINLVKEYGTDGKLNAYWLYGLALIKDGLEFTYTWKSADFYLVDIKSKKIETGYPLNSISLNKKLGKYFTDLTESDKLLIQESDDQVFDFIAKMFKFKISEVDFYYKSNSI